MNRNGGLEFWLMNTLRAFMRCLSGLIPLFAILNAPGQPPQGGNDPREFLEASDGAQIAGTLEMPSNGRLQFVSDPGKKAAPVESGMTFRFSGRRPDAATGLPPFRLEFGLGQRLCGRLGHVDERELILLDSSGSSKTAIARTGAHTLIQRPGETLMLQDGFETIDPKRWSVGGEPTVADDLRVTGDHSLKIPSNGASLTHRLKEPFPVGRLEVAFHDSGVKSEGKQWFIDLTFRGLSGPETIRAILGWPEESLAVETPTGPALAVQRLARKSGWHRLAIRFGQDLTEVGVDGNELAHGKGFSGPLIEVRLASVQNDKAVKTPEETLAGHLDDLRLIKFSETVGGLEIDVSQDEVRLIGGDQIFGEIRGADSEHVKLSVDGSLAKLSWGEITGLFFRRVSTPGAPVEGILASAEWRASSSDDPLDLNVMEGAVVGLSSETLRLATPYAGTLTIPRERITSLHVFGHGRRIVIDPMAHHLGDEISTLSPILDPPQPEGGTLARSFELKDVPEGSAFLVLDVVQVVGEQADVPTFSDMVKRGELRTNVKINGEPFDYLNRYIRTRNETPERIRIPIPRDQLRVGENTVRFEQGGTANDPNYLDDLGILTIALEFPIVRSSGTKPP